MAQLATSSVCSLDEEIRLDSPHEAADPLLVPSSEEPVDIKLVLLIVLVPNCGIPFKALVLAYIPLNVPFCNMFSCLRKTKMVTNKSNGF